MEKFFTRGEKDLLALQDCDKLATACLHELEELGKDLLRLDERRQETQKILEEAQQDCRDQEIHRRALATQTEQARNTLVQKKTQQATLKKQEEYNALGHEIEATLATIQSLEDQELEALMTIDTQKLALEEQTTLTQKRLQEFDETQKALEQQQAEHEQKLSHLQKLLAHARSQLDPKTLADYERVKRLTKGRFPVLCQLEGEYCKGCHLKVSKETISILFQGKEQVCCDQCGRILYLLQ